MTLKTERNRGLPTKNLPAVEGTKEERIFYHKKTPFDKAQDKHKAQIVERFFEHFATPLTMRKRGDAVSCCGH